ncbi:cell wall metabolism sensor histidine kinase WalK [Paenibacillus contaminans]|uniref:histidine kinase n=1 Tax=Paenibacillus contaminans TaxID=450362 RepID=A0A329MHP2_9BACL|nr:cell wall metabolism sensor histidine kinase WalK [Paenibacillus contaminans]RAV19481.1 cell wall metabolism sensor histidine kinase WalK [Paenibacillus contaminans]
MKGFRFVRTIQIKFILIYVLLILFAMQLIGIYFVRTTESSFMNNFTDTLNKQALLLADYVEPKLSVNQESKSGDGKKPGEESITDFVMEWNRVSNWDIQIIDASGIVISTSQQNSKSIVGQKNTQLVVSRALQNIKDKDNEQVFLDTDGYRKKAIAKPVSSDTKVIGAVYIVASMEEIYNTTTRINRIFLSGTLISVAMTALLGVILSHTITSPIKEITKQVTSVAEGNFNQKVKVFSYDEIGQLSFAFNYMTNRLKEALSVNEEEKEKLSSILSNMSDGVVAADDQDHVILINQRAKQMLQLEENEALGSNLYKVLELDKEVALSRINGEQRGTPIMIERIQPQDEDRKIRVTFTPIHRRDLGVTGTIVVLHDVTEQEELELARREFVANVSHELRTPLTTIKSYLEALEDGALEEPALAHRFIGVTRSETERMIRLVTDLLHLSRLDSKQAILAKSWTSVGEMLDEVADRFSFQLQQRRIDIAIEVADEIGEVLLDRDKIDQVLDNLVSNAIKYTGDGGQITVSARLSDSETVEVAVKDNGIGIPKKDLDRIFERFYRVDKARSRNMGGTGLGLSIAREIIKAHGGAIVLESEYNHGTKVTFTLPYVREEETA